MTLYNIGLESGLDRSAFRAALFGMWSEFFAAFLAQRYIAGPKARKLVAVMLNPGIDRPLLSAVTMAGCTAMLMAPMMTLFVTILHNGFSADVVPLWLSKLVVNFPFALCLQIFYVGPLVRWVFKLIFNSRPFAHSSYSQ
jgi:hypothetical protein